MYKYRHEIAVKPINNENIYYYNLYSNDSTEITSIELLFNAIYEKDINLIATETTIFDEPGNYHKEICMFYPNDVVSAINLPDTQDESRHTCVEFVNNSVQIFELSENSLPEVDYITDNVFEISGKEYKHVLSISGTDPESGNSMEYSVSAITTESNPYPYTLDGVEAFFKDIWNMGSQYYLVHDDEVENTCYQDTIIDKKIRPCHSLRYDFNVFDGGTTEKNIVCLLYLCNIITDNSELGFTLNTTSISDSTFFGPSEDLPLPEWVTYTDTVTEV